MGQILDTDNSFRIAIINGLVSCDVKFTNRRMYKDVNYGLIIKPLNLDYNFREPIRQFFKGYPYHVGIIRSTPNSEIIYSFCPDLREPHRGTLVKDIILENIDMWPHSEIFWLMDGPADPVFPNGPTVHQKIEARLMDLMKVRANGSLLLSEEQKRQNVISIEEFNRRHGTSLKMLYNLLSNNCTDVALSVLIGQTRCFQIESIAPIIKKISQMKIVMDMVPEYGKTWLADFKYL